MAKPSEKAVRAAKRELIGHLYAFLMKDDDYIPHELDHDSVEHAAWSTARDQLTREFGLRSTSEDWIEQAIEAIVPKEK